MREVEAGDRVAVAAVSERMAGEGSVQANAERTKVAIQTALAARVEATRVAAKARVKAERMAEARLVAAKARAIAAKARAGAGARTAFPRELKASPITSCTSSNQPLDISLDPDASLDPDSATRQTPPPLLRIRSRALHSVRAPTAVGVDCPAVSLLRSPDAGALGGSTLDPLTQSVLGQAMTSPSFCVRHAACTADTSPLRGEIRVCASLRLDRVRADRERRQSATGIVEDQLVVRARAAGYRSRRAGEMTCASTSTSREECSPASMPSRGTRERTAIMSAQHDWIAAAMEQAHVEDGQLGI
mgnify:CR=1 FL=1